MYQNICCSIQLKQYLFACICLLLPKHITIHINSILSILSILLNLFIASREFTIITPTPSSNNGDEDNNEQKYNTNNNTNNSNYQLYQSATSKDEQQLYNATVLPSTTILPVPPSMALNVSAKQVTFGNNNVVSAVSPRSVTSTITTNTNTLSSATSISSQNSIPSVPTPISPDNTGNHNFNRYHRNSNAPSSSPWSARPRLNNQQSSTSFKKASANNHNHFTMDETKTDSSAELKVNQSMNVRNNNNRNGNNNGLKIRSSDIASCPNLVNQKCRCKDILQQNPSAQKIWSGCYRVSITNKNQHYDNREIDIAFFDGLYHGLCKYFQYEVDTDRIPSKKDIAIIIKNHKGFVIDGKNGLGIDRCHFVEFWKWFRGCCDIVKDIYRVWDTQFPFQMEIFVNRKKCQQLLQDTPDGIYIYIHSISLFLFFSII